MRHFSLLFERNGSSRAQRCDTFRHFFERNGSSRAPRCDTFRYFLQKKLSRAIATSTFRSPRGSFFPLLVSIPQTCRRRLSLSISKLFVCLVFAPHPLPPSLVFQPSSISHFLTFSLPSPPSVPPHHLLSMITCALLVSNSIMTSLPGNRRREPGVQQAGGGGGDHRSAGRGHVGNDRAVARAGLHLSPCIPFLSVNEYFRQ